MLHEGHPRRRGRRCRIGDIARRDNRSRVIDSKSSRSARHRNVAAVSVTIRIPIPKACEAVVDLHQVASKRRDWTRFSQL